MRILVQKSPRPRRWAGVATVAVLMLTLWCVRQPDGVDAAAPHAAGAAPAEPGSSFLDHLQAPSAVHAAGNGLAAPQGAALPHATQGEEQVASVAGEHAWAAAQGAALHAPAEIGHSAGVPADTQRVAAPASHSAQRTGVAESSSRSTPGETPTR